MYFPKHLTTTYDSLLGWPVDHRTGEAVGGYEFNEVKRAQEKRIPLLEREMDTVHEGECQTDNHTAGVHVIRSDDVTNGNR